MSEQIAYYRARAPEYDDWWERRGAYDVDAKFRERWRSEIAILEAALERFEPRGSVLEIAAGTGLWTEKLTQRASKVVALDASPEALALNRRRIRSPQAKVDYVVADAFSWQPSKRYDVVFFSFWLSHVPPERFEAFFELVAAALAPGGRFFFIDNAPPRPGTDPSRRHGSKVVEGVGSVTDLEAGTSLRQVADGRWFRIVKCFYEPDELVERLGDLGFDARVKATAWAFVYGHGARRRAPA